MPVDGTSSSQPRLSDSPRVRFSDRMLAEAVNALVQIEPQQTDDVQADEIARNVDGDFERRVVVRAQSLPVAASLQSALQHVRQSIVLMVLAGVALAMMAGAAAARAALVSPRGEPVNFYWALGTVLGVQTVLLLIWFVLLFASRRFGSHTMKLISVGGLLIRAAQFLAGKAHRGPLHAAAIAATGTAYTRGKLGRWSVSAISHGLWLAFNVACLMMLILFLGARQYTFAWETTLLSQREYVPLTNAIAYLPRKAGFVTPTSEQVQASQWTGNPLPNGEVSQAWSGLLIGAIVLYGFAPRLLLLGLSLGQRRHAASTYRLDVSRPEYVHLQSRLMPSSTPIGVVDADDGDVSALQVDEAPRSTLPTRPLGPPAILGFELPARTGKSHWPPPLHQVRWLDLGMVDTRDDQRQALEQLKQAPAEPSTVVVVCALTATPDRGAGTFLAELQRVLAQPLSVVLTGGQSLRQRVDAQQLNQRVQDWRNLARSAGVEEVRTIELDLDHLTQASAANLAAIATMNGAQQHRPMQRHIEAAFDLIINDATEWLATNKTPTTAQQAELHRNVARLYRDEHALWRELLAAPASLGTNAVEQVKASAHRMIDLLPARLQRSPKWIAAGAMAGALGCVAAATLVTPVAIASLPLWTAIGGGISTLISLSRGESKPKQPESPDSKAIQSQAFDVVRAAALFAMLLELQGRNEQTITHILDEVVDEDVSQGNAEGVKTSEAVRRWLDRLRHRMDVALQREASR